MADFICLRSRKGLSLQPSTTLTGLTLDFGLLALNEVMIDGPDVHRKSDGYTCLPNCSLITSLTLVMFRHNLVIRKA